jgi:large subunit ribosomal protein L17
VYDKKVVEKVFDELGPRYSSRPGGYSRMVKLGPRQGDGARMAQLELIAEQA